LRKCVSGSPPEDLRNLRSLRNLRTNKVVISKMCKSFAFNLRWAWWTWQTLSTYHFIHLFWIYLYFFVHMFKGKNEINAHFGTKKNAQFCLTIPSFFAQLKNIVISKMCKSFAFNLRWGRWTWQTLSTDQFIHLFWIYLYFCVHMFER